jgi:hypothetical protein
VSSRKKRGNRDKKEGGQVEQARGTEHKRLEVLIGRWKTKGRTREMPGAAATEIDAVDRYEWLPGGFGLLHVVDARVGDVKVEGAEIIGYDSNRGAYVTLSVGSDGSVPYEATLNEESDGLTWRMRSQTTRFTGIFNQDGEITGYWELLSGGEWRPWMDITLTRQEGFGG